MERILKLKMIIMLLLVDEPQGICAENTYKNIYTSTCLSQRSDSDITSDTPINVESVRYARLVCDRSVFGVSVNPVYNDRLNCSVDDNNDVVSFCFYNITAEDSGRYTVDFSTTRKNVTIYVMDKPTLPTISPSSATEGQTVTLTCASSSTSTPSPTGQPITYTWTVDGATPTASRYTVSGNRLTIQNVHRVDKNRMFQCVAKETNGLSSERKDITLNVQYRPIVAISPSTVSPVEGQTNLRLTCTVTEANPRSITGYRWYKDGTPSNILSTQQTYTITTVTRGHAGVYHCQAENSVGWSVSPASVTINVLFRPIVSVSPSAQTPNEGQSDLRLTCTIEEANPRSITGYRWYKEGAPSNILSTQQTYTITTVTRGHAGVYHCQAENSVGWSVSFASVTVNVLYKPTVILNSTRDSIVAVENEQGLTISCKVTESNPSEVTYRWSKQGATVSNSAAYSFSTVMKTDKGTYQCTASNSVGVSSPVDVTIEVQYGPTVTCGQERYTIEEGDDFIAACSAEANPPPTYKWAREGQNTPVGNSNNLMINSINRLQSGNYTLTATNTLSPTGISQIQRKDTKHIQIDVQYGPDKSVNLTPNDKVITAVENASVNLPSRVCSAICNPPCTYSWSGPFSSSTGQLNLGNSLRRKNGTYTCTAQNTVVGNRNRQSHLELFVKVYYGANITRLHADGGPEFKERDNITMTCQVDSYPSANISWTKSSSGSKEVGHGQMYTVDKADCLDTGMYTCTAFNSYGKTVDQSLQILVKCYPRLPARTSTTDNVGLALPNHLNLSTSVIAYPQPHFTWYYRENGSLINTTAGNGFITSNSKNNFTAHFSTLLEEENDFGTYFLVASNSEKSNVFIKQWKVTKRGPPHVPYDVEADCIGYQEAKISWTASFNGGATQSFTVLYKQQGHERFIDSKINVKSNGQFKRHFFTFTSLKQQSVYIFIVRAANALGSTDSAEINCITAERRSEEGRIEYKSNGFSTGSFFGGFACAAFLGVVLFFGIFLWRRKTTGKRDSPTMIYESATTEMPESHTYSDLNPTSVIQRKAKTTSSKKIYESATTEMPESHTYSDLNPKSDIQRKAKTTSSKKNSEAAGTVESHTYSDVNMQKPHQSQDTSIYMNTVLQA